MKNNLVIVESPAKAKTIEKYLGKDFIVKASVGHIKDLPKSELGVDVEKNFKPKYVVIAGKKKVIDDIKNAAKKVENVYLAPDPDREGEAIAWHISEELKGLKNGPQIRRVLFNEITKKAVNEAILHPTKVNVHMYEAQQARRILDRLVGYQISPLLWDKVKRGLSAGRVQSVAVRLICEREEEILKFKAEEYWSLEVDLLGSKKPQFRAYLHKISEEKAALSNEKITSDILEQVKKSPFVLSEIQKREQKRNPTAPFITSKLQQEAARKLGFTAKRTMMVAQKLYEGVELGDEVVGLITYMRTDSTRISDQAIAEVREYIGQTYGPQYVPATPNIYKTKKAAQDAHEAIRPTSMVYTLEKVRDYLKKDEYRLYELIWKKFIACQMEAARLDRTTFIINADKYEWRATGSVIKFPGFLAAYREDTDEGEKKEEGDEENILPELKEGEKLKVLNFFPEQHFTQPPPRFTEASLVKELEEKGIGRPSTYASILTVIQDKKYVEKNDQKKFAPTSLGKIVNDLLVQNFPNILDVQFTARMEGELDDVEEGTLSWTDALKDFYLAFSKVLGEAKIKMKDIKRQEIETPIKCNKCGAPMVIKFGRHGEFLACQAYPGCKNSSEFRKNEKGEIEILVPETTTDICEKCQKPMVVKHGKFGKFLACSGYPTCKNSKSMSVGANCPQCQKPLAERRSKKGKIFFGCTGYPACNFASWDKPINQACPQCQSPYLLIKPAKSGESDNVCPNKECGYRVQVEAVAPHT